MAIPLRSLAFGHCDKRIVDRTVNRLAWTQPFEESKIEIDCCDDDAKCLAGPKRNAINGMKYFDEVTVWRLADLFVNTFRSFGHIIPIVHSGDFIMLSPRFASRHCTYRLPQRFC